VLAGLFSQLAKVKNVKIRSEEKRTSYAAAGGRAVEGKAKGPLMLIGVFAATMPAIACSSAVLLVIKN